MAFKSGSTYSLLLGVSALTMICNQGRSQTFSFREPLEGPVLQQGELSMVCVGLSERDLNNFGGARQNFLGEVAPPWHPPSSAPVYKDNQARSRKMEREL